MLQAIVATRWTRPVTPASSPAETAAKPLPAASVDSLVISPPALPLYDFTLDNRVAVHFDPPAIYRAMDEMVTSARETIKVNFFIMGGSQAMHLSEILARKAAAGVKVQVLLDPKLGVLPPVRRQSKQLIEYLEAHGVEVAKTNLVALPPLPDRKDRNVVDHNKLIVVDDRQALSGGMNLADEFDTFHDVMVQVEGPAAGQMGRQFDYDWYFARHPGAADQQPPIVGLPKQSAVPDSHAGLATVRVNSTGVGRQTQRAAVLETLGRATGTLDVAMLHLSDDEILDALIAAHNRGVRVRVLLDPEEYEQFSPLLRYAPKGIVNAYAVHRLRQAGIDVRHFRTDPQQTTLHQKMAIIDGRTLLVGSSNWTPRAMDFNSETSLEVHGGHAPPQAQAEFDRDWDQRSKSAGDPGDFKRAAGWIYSYWF